MSGKKFNIGIVGYGFSAKVFQIPFINDSSSFQLKAIVQRKGDEASEENPNCTIYRSPKELFVDESIDVVVLSTPPATHYELAVQALTAGRHVVVEKPFCPTSSECDALIKLAEEKQRILTVFQNRRWDSDFRTLQRILPSLGQVVEFETHFDRYDPEIPDTWTGEDSQGGGVAYDLGVHLIDQVVVLYGLPSHVTGFVSRQRIRNTSGPLDACTILLHYKDGPLVTVKASAVSADEDQLRFWVRGTKGSYRKSSLDVQEPQIMSGMSVQNLDFGCDPSEKSGTLTVHAEGKLQRYPQPNDDPIKYTAFYHGLGQALEKKQTPPVTAVSARNNIRIVELAIQSSEKGRTLEYS